MLAARIAAAQGGAISHAQLLGIGLTRSAVKYWRQSGRLHPWYRGVYALGHGHLGPRGRLWAAVLACGDGAVISHQSAAALWTVRQTRRSRIDVTVAGRSRAGCDGIDLHLVRRLDPRDVIEDRRNPRHHARQNIPGSGRGPPTKPGETRNQRGRLPEAL